MSIARPCSTQEERPRHSVTNQWRTTINNKHGEKLVGILHDTGSKGLVILCHGIHSSKECIPLMNLAADLEREGISAFRFDFAGNGESEGAFQYGNYRREAYDLHAVIEHFRREGCEIIAIIGHSKGGNVVLLYASMFNDISIVINISGRFNLERGMEGPLGKDFLQRIKQKGFIDVRNKRGKFEYCVTEESLMDRLSMDTHATSLLIQPECRVLTVHGSMDKIVPLEDAMEFAKFIPNHKLHIIEGANHEYTSHQDELASVVLHFIRAHFHPDRDIHGRLPLCTRVDQSAQSRL
ncbi:hypothetical protein CJ030_MR3G009459 [Morella rubra]|uniref:Serine aminopeptidase S33 domain-containing protein n=1 Tax=Morella rubra TaxID=262757 RepID=A0A6A1W6V0_9ROSI|nr:hypothetical protein CJ030_MR3G009459 [Morella rubra]